MELETIKIFSQVAGIGGISLGVFLILFRDIIRKNIFPKFKNEELSYRLLRLIVIVIWSIAVIGIGAWIYTSYFSIQRNNKIDIPKFTNLISSPDDSTKLWQFIDSNRGDLIYISTKISLNLARINKVDDNDDLFIAEEFCEESDLSANCAGFHLIIKGNNHICEYHNQGLYIFNGYFTLEENRWMHQGIYYVLNSIPRQKILLRK